MSNNDQRVQSSLVSNRNRSEVLPHHGQFYSIHLICLLCLSIASRPIIQPRVLNKLIYYNTRIDDGIVEWIYNAAKASSSRGNLLPCQVNPLGAIGTIYSKKISDLWNEESCQSNCEGEMSPQ